MTQNMPKLPCPLWVIALDLIGTFIIAFGVYLIVAPHAFMPESLRFEHEGQAFVMLGFLLAAPIPMFIIKAAKDRKKPLSTDKSESTTAEPGQPS